MEYRGGTYISQLTGVGIVEAIKAWSSSGDPTGNAVKLRENWAIDLIRRIDDNDDGFFYPMDGLRSVWFLSFLIEDERAFVNVVKTQSE